METKHEKGKPNSYQVRTTQYEVTPVFRDAPSAEHIAIKIERLILQDGKQKPH